MKKIDIVGIAFGNFKRRKTRSVLTVLGVVIGVASIVVMVSLGIAVNVFFDKQTEQMGDLTTITVRPGWDPETGQQKGSLNDETIAQLEALDKVDAVSPEISLYGKLASGKYVTHASIIGIRWDLLDKLGFETEQGTLEGFGDSTKKDIKCLIGYEVPYQFYNPRERGRGGSMGGMSISFGGMSMGGSGGEEVREPPPVDVMLEDSKVKFTFDYSYGEPKQPGQDMTVKKPVLYKMSPLGTLKKGSNDYDIYVDIEIAKQLKKDQQKLNESGGGGDMMMNGGGGTSRKKNELTYDTVKVITGSIDDTIAVTETIKKELGLEAYSSAEYINSTKQIANILQLILGGIGSISLLVAAIGITNTMIMSIYERTKEIGIMKVIGCQLKDIRTMFLCEAGFIGLFGGAAGLIISYTISFILNLVTKGGGEGGGGGLAGMLFGGMGGEAVKLSVIPPWLAIAAVVFAIMVGLISGFLPARRAMKLSALEAMRN